VVQLSWANPSYSARSVAVGGAFTSLGADMSSHFINPAGIGMYRSIEVVYGPNFSFKNTASSYLNNTENASNFLMEAGTFGLVFSLERNRKNLKYLNFGLAYHQSNHQNLRRQYSGFKQESSYFFFDIEPGLGLQQEESISTKGSRYGEFVLSLAGNYNERFFIGANIGVPRYVFNQEFRFSEADINNNVPDLTEVVISENDSIWTIDGAYVGLGISYKLTENVRFGANIKSGTYYTLFEDYVLSEIIADDDGNEVNYGDPLQEIEFNLRQPFSANAGLAFLNRKGFISVDATYQPNTRFEYSDDNTTELTDSSYLWTQNRLIRRTLKDVFNIRAGGELIIKEDYRLRAGYQYLMSPIVDKRELSDQHVISLGAGVRKTINEIMDNKSAFFVDVALVFATYKNRYRPYDFADDIAPPIVDFNYIRTNLNTTFGIKFWLSNAT